MKITPYHPSVASVAETGSYDAAMQRAREYYGPTYTDLPSGNNTGEIIYVTTGGTVRIARGTYSEIARLLRHHGYQVNRIT